MAEPLLTDSEIEAALAKLPGWERDDSMLRAEFVFPNFVAAFSFMAEVADDAERLNHHPEWSNVYNRVNVGLTTHDSGGLTNYDVELATAMNISAAKHSKG